MQRAFGIAVVWLVLGSCGVCGCNGEKPVPPGDWKGSCTETPRAGLLQRLFAKQRTPSWVTDEAAMLDAPAKAELTRRLEAFHAETCHQLLVMTVPSLQGQSIEQYSLARFDDISPGYRRFNNGLMLLIARDDHRLRIEVGCGLEDVISDPQAADILRQVIEPRFRAGDFSGGIRSGMDELMALARKKVIPTGYRPSGCPTAH